MKLVRTNWRRPTALAIAAFAALPAAFAQTTPPDDDTIVLSPFEVSTEGDTGYRSTFTTSGTLVREELVNLPSTISVLNQEFIQDIGAVNIFEASRYATGGEYGQQNDTIFVFRGIQNNWQARNFFIWYLPTDNFSVERLEIVRGPNALLYGDAQPGGLMNIISKRANVTRDNNSARVMVGSWERYRGEVDINRVLVPNKLAIRVNAAAQESEDWRDFRYDRFAGIHGALQYNPFRNTRIRTEVEVGSVDRNLGHGIFTDNFSGATTQAIPAGQSWIVVDGTLQQFTGAAGTRSTGAGLLLTDNSPVSREYQFTGPDRYQDRRYTQFGLYLEQTLFDRLTLEAAYNLQDQENLDIGFQGANALRRDTAAVLPDGSPNPNLNKLYVDRTLNELNVTNNVNDLRFSAVYELEIPDITTQRLIGFWAKRIDRFDAENFQERRIDNLNNQVFRRHYVEDYSAAELRWSTLPNTRKFGTGFWAHNKQSLTSRSFASVGSYLDGRLRSLVGYRHDQWDAELETSFNGRAQIVAQPNPAGGTVNEVVGYTGNRAIQAPIKDESINYGLVAHLLKDEARGYSVSLFGNYSESFRPVSGALTLTGQTIPPIKGEGTEYGLRLEAFSGKVALNVIKYEIDQTNTPVGVNAAIRNEINAMFFTGPNGELLPGAVLTGALANQGDSSTQRSEGYEVELTLNPARGWTLTANYSNNDLSQTDVLPATLPFWERARAENRPITDYQQLDNLVAPTLANANLVVPELEESFNFFTRYEFTQGGLDGFFVGAGANYRSGAYLGFVGGAPFYSDSSLVWNGLLGYKGAWRGYDYTLSLNINNVTDEDYYVAFAYGAAGWSNPREFRLAASFEF